MSFHLLPSVNPEIREVSTVSVMVLGLVISFKKTLHLPSCALSKLRYHSCSNLSVHFGEKATVINLGKVEDPTNVCARNPAPCYAEI